MKYGVQYYPEHWPEERWSVDAEMMQRAGINVVRMGEFAWSVYEPREGEPDFSWMERAIELLGNHGIQTIMSTCSRTPPPWVYHTHPGVVNVGQDGLPQHTDGRYRVGLAHPEFIELAQRIDEAVIRHFASNDNIVAWQVDNEIGCWNDCYCPVCRKAFQAYLKEKYGTPEKLNEAWGHAFWSFAFNDFAAVPTPGSQPQLNLEYRRFLSQLNVEFSRWRAGLIHKLDPGKPVTINFQSFGAAHTDYHQLGATVDVNGFNHYPSRSPELALDYYRGARGEVWAIEQHSRLQHVDTPEGWMRLWAWLAVAHGATAVVFFRWRQCRWGQEQFADGILSHSGEENRFYQDLSRMGEEIKQAADYIDPTKPVAHAAITFSYESRWSVRAGLFGRELDPVEEAIEYHRALHRRTTAIDSLDPREDLSTYRLVIAPRLWLVDEAIAENLERYVKGGGTLCLTAGSGVVDMFGKSFDTPHPGLLRELAGVTVSDLAYQEDLRLALQSTIIPGLNGAYGRLAADEIHPDSAKVIATYADGWRRERPAITMNNIGNGHCIYIGALLEDDALEAVVDWLCGIAGVMKRIETPKGVSVCERRSDDSRIMFLINWNDSEQVVHLDGAWLDVFSDEEESMVVIGANDLKILRSME